MKKSVEQLSLACRVNQFSSMFEIIECTKKGGDLTGIEPGMERVMHMLYQARENENTVYVIGNGGSAAVASHAVTDLTNVAKFRAFTLHDQSLLTCMVNDYGYENAFSRILGQVAKKEDILIAISSSGRSMNICNAASRMADIGGKVVTFTGFARDNSLRSLGDMNIWLDSDDYGFVEIGHQFILHNLSDRFGRGWTHSDLRDS